MTGLTREGPKIDRVACTWLISRLVDQAPEFRHVPASQVLQTAELTRAVPYAQAPRASRRCGCERSTTAPIRWPTGTPDWFKPRSGAATNKWLNGSKTRAVFVRPSSFLATVGAGQHHIQTHRSHSGMRSGLGW